MKMVPTYNHIKHEFSISACSYARQVFGKVLTMQRKCNLKRT